jgi:hypothetical protein
MIDNIFDQIAVLQDAPFIYMAAYKNDFIDTERQTFVCLLRIDSFDLRHRQLADSDAGNPLTGLKRLKVLPN